jgi:hypothetical protein
MLNAHDFSAIAAVVGLQIHVTFSGTADLTVKPELDRFLEDLHVEAIRQKTNEILVDVKRLEFMSSSCLKSLVWWIGTVQERFGGVHYHIVFITSPTVYWQRRSLNALACLASDIISIQP